MKTPQTKPVDDSIPARKVTVRSLPLKDVIRDMADAFEVVAKRDCEVYSIDLPESVGVGRVRGINFPSGLALLFYDCKFLHPVEFHFDGTDIHPAKFIYSLEGKVTHRFSDADEINEVDAYEGIMVGSLGQVGHSLYFGADEHVVLGSIEINRRLFSKDYQCELKNMGSPLHVFLCDVEADREFFHKSYLSLSHWKVMDDVVEDRWTGLFQRLFLQAKALDILLWAMLEYRDDQLGDGKGQLIRKSEIELIHNAAELIALHLAEPMNIEQLAQAVGTNANKLQDGFKKSYGTTVNGYLQKLRLDKTCHYLETTDMSVSEIVAKIGLTNHGYHSKMFKQNYGLSPKEYRLKIKKNSD